MERTLRPETPIPRALGPPLPGVLRGGHQPARLRRPLRRPELGDQHPREGARAASPQVRNRRKGGRPALRPRLPRGEGRHGDAGPEVPAHRCDTGANKVAIHYA